VRDATQQNERVETVAQLLLRAGACSVLDLGCGNGELVARLALEPQCQCLLGIDISPLEIAAARASLGTAVAHGRLQLECGSFTDMSDRFKGFDAAVLMETIEHLDPRTLGELERAVFGHFAPATVIVTTPNREYNTLYGLASDEMRHTDHRFEWTRARFRRWATGVAQRMGYEVCFGGIGEPHEALGFPTQFALFIVKASGAPSA
jgi:small RNA 2'-O-methyltransferase